MKLMHVTATYSTAGHDGPDEAFDSAIALVKCPEAATKQMIGYFTYLMNDGVGTLDFQDPFISNFFDFLDAMAQSLIYCDATNDGYMYTTYERNVTCVNFDFIRNTYAVDENCNS